MENKEGIRNEDLRISRILFHRWGKSMGYCGSVMCLHLSERKAEPENVCVCLATGEDVNTYTDVRINTATVGRSEDAACISG